MKKTKFLLACALSVCALGVMSGTSVVEKVCAEGTSVNISNTTDVESGWTLNKDRGGRVSKSGYWGFYGGAYIKSDDAYAIDSSESVTFSINSRGFGSRTVSNNTYYFYAKDSSGNVLGEASFLPTSGSLANYTSTMKFNDNADTSACYIYFVSSSSSTSSLFDGFASIVMNYTVGSTSTTEYTVSFDSDGGTAVASQTVKENKKATEPAAPTKDGFKFAGWYNGDTKYDFNSNVTDTVSLKAKWLEYYTVSFNSDGGTEVASIKVAETEKATKPADPTKAGYLFVNWVDKDGKEFDFTNTVITGNTELKATYVVDNRVSVKFIVDGNVVETKKVNPGSTVTAVADPFASDKYVEFKGWSADDGKTFFDFTQPITETTVLKAVVVESYDDVSKMKAGETVKIKGEITANYKANRYMIQTVNGCAIISTSNKSTGTDDAQKMKDIKIGNEIVIEAKVDYSDTSNGLYAISNISSIKVTNQNDTDIDVKSISSFEKSDSGKYVVIEDYFVSSIGNKKLYSDDTDVFLTYESTEYTPTMTSELFNNAAGKHFKVTGTFAYANDGTKKIWVNSIEEVTPKYSVTFHYNNGEENETLKIEKNSTLNGMSNPTAPTGKVFMGWYTDEALTKEFDSVTGTMDVYAKYGYDIKTNFTTANTDVSFQLAFGYDKTTKDDGTVVYSNFTGITLRVCVSNDKVSELAADSVGIAVAKDNIVERETKNTTVRAIDFKNAKTQTLDNEKLGNDFIAEVTNISLDNCLTYIYFVPYAVGNSCTYVTEEYSICVDSVIDEYLEMDIAEESKVILRALKAAIAEANPEA